MAATVSGPNSTHKAAWCGDAWVVHAAIQSRNVGASGGLAAAGNGAGGRQVFGAFCLETGRYPLRAHPRNGNRGAVQSLQPSNWRHPIASHAEKKSPMRMKFKSAAAMLVLCLVSQAQAETLLGKVIHVQDGDSITVLDDTRTQHKIRLTGIDAPERRQAFGSVSKESLAEQVAGQSVAVEWDKVDRYGRKVGKVLLGGLDRGRLRKREK